MLSGAGMALYFQFLSEPAEMAEQLAAQRPGRLPLHGRVVVAQQIGELVLAPPGLRQLLGQSGLELPAGRLGSRLGDGVGADEAPERPDRRGELPQHRCEALAGRRVLEHAVVRPGFVRDRARYPRTVVAACSRVSSPSRSAELT